MACTRIRFVVVDPEELHRYRVLSIERTYGKKLVDTMSTCLGRDGRIGIFGCGLLSMAVAFVHLPKIGFDYRVRKDSVIVKMIGFDYRVRRDTRI